VDPDPRPLDLAAAERRAGDDMSHAVDALLPPFRTHGAGAPLLLISGLGSKGTSWRPFLQIAAQRHRVLTFDSRGAGASPPLDGPIAIRDLARDALALLDHLGLARVAVMGRSMGGMIAQELALLAPARVERLVLVSTSGRVDAHLREVFLHWAELAEAGVTAHLRHRASMLWCLGSDAMADPDLVAPYLRGKLDGDRPRDYALQARACAAHDALRRLRRLSLPALVIAGGDDRLMPPRHAEALAKAVPGAELALIPGAGHLVHLEAAKAFSREVMRFLAAGGPV
jgi:pimeloyl-ACP methyl ester carboxylesterase